jgi:hypothetical protein
MFWFIFVELLTCPLMNMVLDDYLKYYTFDFSIEFSLHLYFVNEVCSKILFIEEYRRRVIFILSYFLELR